MYAYTALIPAYCPGKALIPLVRELRDNNIVCVVVNDGSPSDYDVIFQSISSMAVVLQHKENKGKGAALKTGLAYIQKHLSPCMIATVDADGQHLFQDVLHTLKKAVTNSDSLVLGVRCFQRSEVPFKSYFGNKITETVFRLFTGVHVSDTQTGLRAFSSDLIDSMLEVQGERYEYEMNQLLYCVRKSIPFQEVTITTVYENNNAASHFHPFRDSFLIYRQILHFALSSLSSFLVDLSAFAVLSSLFKGSTGILLSNILARILSASFNYECNRKIVFHDDSSHRESAVKYILLAGAVLALNTGILSILVSMMGINRIFAKILTEAVLFFFSWGMQNRYVFKNNRKQEIQNENQKENVLRA